MIKNGDIIRQLLACTLRCQVYETDDLSELAEYFEKEVFFSDKALPSCLPFFNRIRRHFTPGQTVCVEDPLCTFTVIVCLPDSFLILGPYLLEKPTDNFIGQVTAAQKLPLSMIPPLRHFYSLMPVMPHIRLQSVARILMEYSGLSGSDNFLLFSMDEKEEKAEDWLQIQKTYLPEYQSMLEEKYQNDLNLCGSLMAGDMEACMKSQRRKDSSFIPLDPKRNDFFNYVLYDYVFNVLYRIIAYAAGVPAIDIQDLQDRWNNRINNRGNSTKSEYSGAEMLASYCRLIQKKDFKGHSPYVRKALSYMDSHLSTEITMKELAAYVGISVGHLSRIFKEEMGESPMGYINHQRILKSLPFLKRGLMKIQDISLCVGIEDSNYYSRLFKRYMGMSPVQYQEQVRGGNGRKEPKGGPDV